MQRSRPQLSQLKVWKEGALDCSSRARLLGIIEGAERPRLKIKGTPIHYLLARRATAQLESQRLWRSKGDLNARSAPKRHE